VWARKESVLKASGHGLVVDPRQVIVTGPKEPPALVSWRGEHPLDGPVQLADVELGDPSHVAAVAVLAPDPLTLRVLSG